MAKSPFLKIIDRAAKVADGIKLLADRRVLVGIPSSTSMRDDGSGITNAALGYIHEHGAPEANIPPRPWLRPSVNAAQDEIAAGLKVAGKFALDGKPDMAEKALEVVGLRMQNKIKARINSNIPPPLSPRTIAARKAKKNRSTRTLVVTGEFRNSVSYVVRSRASGKDFADGGKKGGET